MKSNESIFFLNFVFLNYLEASSWISGYEDSLIVDEVATPGGNKREIYKRKISVYQFLFFINIYT